MKEVRLTQKEKVLRHLEAFGTITPMEGIQDYGIMRLASRVSELRKEGYVIITDMVYGLNRFQEKTRYAKYRLEEFD